MEVASCFFQGSSIFFNCFILIYRVSFLVILVNLARPFSCIWIIIWRTSFFHFNLCLVLLLLFFLWLVFLSFTFIIGLVGITCHKAEFLMNELQGFLINSTIAKLAGEVVRINCFLSFAQLNCFFFILLLLLCYKSLGFHSHFLEFVTISYLLRCHVSVLLSLKVCLRCCCLFHFLIFILNVSAQFFCR